VSYDLTSLLVGSEERSPRIAWLRLIAKPAAVALLAALRRSKARRRLEI
jgi:hypothetical protein